MFLVLPGYVTQLPESQGLLLLLFLIIKLFRIYFIFSRAMGL